MVSRDENGDVRADQRLVQEEFYEALFLKDAGARTRIIGQLMQSTSRAEQEARDFVLFIRTCKAQYNEEFHLAKKTGRPPPDVTHPDHVDVRDDGSLIITGPVDRPAREFWEKYKAIVKIAVCLHQHARAAYRQAARWADLQGLELA